MGKAGEGVNRRFEHVNFLAHMGERISSRDMGGRGVRRNIPRRLGGGGEQGTLSQTKRVR